MAMQQASLFAPTVAVGRIPDPLTMYEVRRLAGEPVGKLARSETEWFAVSLALADMAAGRVTPTLERVELQDIRIPTLMRIARPDAAYMQNHWAAVLQHIEGRRLVGATEIGPLIRDRNGVLWVGRDRLAVIGIRWADPGIAVEAPVFAWGGVGQ